MDAEVREVLSRVEHWPEDDQEELAQLALEIEARRHGVYHATPEELRSIDEALAAVERGEIASDDEVEAVFAKHTAVISSERKSL
jgi:DNA-binding FadR family transcriptional regulator